MDAKKLLKEIIPPNDYQHRNGFSNEQLIDKLGEEERIVLELIARLQRETDILIVETLAYMRSEKSLPVLYNV